MDYKKRLIRLGQFFRILDEYGNHNISLTNVAVIIVLVKLSMAPAVSITDIGALLISLFAYTSKKVINKTKPTEVELPEIIGGKIDSIKAAADTAAVTADNRFTNIEEMIGKIKDKMGIKDLVNIIKPRV